MRVVFDFGGVLFQWRPADLLKRALPRHAADDEQAAHWVQQIFQGYGGDWGEFDRGVVEPPALSEQIARRTGLQAADVMAVIDAVADELQPIAASVNLLERLHAAGTPLHYLSNMPIPYADHLDRSHAFLGRFTSGVYSGRVQLVKPDPAIFEHAATHFGARPDELVFLDDHPPNVAAARAAGWQALQFSNAAQAERDLRAAGWWPDAG
ncbi:HAD family hydrolase [Aquabacterium sp.]|uniref:HAD family hydrolase n=1 Tax=Aquabacterium sp. TaxID=1872578 RepID=UPI002B694A2A|nr:HAD family phosphatase [Aquabacterium sp.]HSW05374.1 HAD family phosphatase [Aquabacterium sp.]